MQNRAVFVLATLFTSGLLVAAGVTGASAAGAAGSLDPTFGHDGIVLANAGTGAVATDAILQSNGDIVVADQYGLVRFLPDGSLDPAFGTDGVASTGFDDLGLGPSGVAIQPNGQIIWVGNTTKPDGIGGEITDFAIARFNANGSLDPAFGTGGLVTTEFFADPLAGAMELADSVLVEPGGGILVGGVARQGQNKAAPYYGALALFNANGTLDSAFGSGGQVLSTSVGNNISAIGLDASGDIWVLPADAELTSAGQVDSTVTPAAITSSSTGGAAAFLPSGQYVIGQTVGVGKHDDEVQVTYFNAGGTLAAASPEFHYTGTSGEDGAAAVAVQPNGQAVVGGSHFLATSVFGLARVNTNGSLDATFGNSGTVTTDIQGDDAIGAIVIQPNGDIVAAGMSEDNSTGQTDVAVARYIG
jgi:uncharacterized delta-60 repeat protein